MPALPTIAESGLPGYESAVWMGMLAPAGTPREIVDKVSTAMQTVLHAADVKAALRVQGLDTVGSTPEEFSKFLARDIERYAQVIRDAKIDRSDNGGHSGLSRILDAASIAVIGASDDLAKVGGRTVHLLRHGSYGGAVFPINPKRETIQGLPCFASVGAVGHAVDLCVIAVAAADVEGHVQQCLAVGVGGIIVLSSGYAEQDAEGAQRQAALAALVASRGVPMIGPNCPRRHERQRRPWSHRPRSRSSTASSPAAGSAASPPRAERSAPIGSTWFSPQATASRTGCRPATRRTST